MAEARKLLVAVALGLAAAGGIAEARELDLEAARDTSRLSIALAGSMYASYPMSLGDAGPSLIVATPLWLGTRHRYFQWGLDANLVTGFGTESHHAYLTLSPQVGFDLFLGGLFGFEVNLGIGGVLQAGERTVGGLAYTGSGGYTFRFWSDDRVRLKLLMHMHTGGWFAEDPGNDVGTNASALGVGLGFETPL